MTRFLLVSNGHGEDVIAAAVGRHLRAAGADLRAVPLVGRGDPYAAADVEVLGPRDAQPSGGYLLRSPRLLWTDLRAGWLGSARQRWHALRAAARDVDACLVVGDVVALAAATGGAPRPRFYLPSAVSVLAWPPTAPPWRQPFGPFERTLMGRAAAVYPRDAATAGWLTAHGVARVHDLGNPMLDAVEGHADVAAAPPYLLLLPGTRGDAAFSLPRMLDAVRALGPAPAAWVAWAGAGPPPAAPGWAFRADGGDTGRVGAYRHADGTDVGVARGAFARLVEGARAAISTSGTAAEQCAGRGVPLVGFVTDGPQYTATFADGQRRALGAALTLVAPEPDAIARATRRALDDEALRADARRDGHRAMGEPGAAWRVAHHVLDRLGMLARATPYAGAAPGRGTDGRA